MSVFHTSPAVRFGIRQVVVAVATYVASGLSTGFDDWKAFALGALGAGITAVVGLLTPVEPFVGIKPNQPVEVPSPPADPEPPK